ncbi:protein phosphatase 1 regulatory subunit 3C-B [Entelurus aequoreus]|uniref:protein phosphatase 1 regulatory subunit 3C-B n=1 Tax=Entelurus aequoreus TaxID=161455 RepID=UPI002B1E07C3|nr:protein phosphatase 1 regulatory subunit 3C-B [Entelurus aequoreus]
MNNTRVPPAFNTQTTGLPVDLAVCLSQRRPLDHLPAMKPSFEPTNSLQRSSFHSSHLSSSTEPGRCFQKDGGLHKKRVVFADAKGLALTAVRLFVPDTSNKSHRHKYGPGFPQPTLDFPAFSPRPPETHVRLESCSVSERSLSGKVHVFHGGADRAVHVKVTFDSWWHHYDVPCVFLQQRRCRGFDVDVYAFDLCIPRNIEPMNEREFCVVFGPSRPHWDNNRGHNYKVHKAKQRPPSWLSSTDVFGTGPHDESEWVGKHCMKTLRSTELLAHASNLQYL